MIAKERDGRIERIAHLEQMDTSTLDDVERHSLRHAAARLRSSETTEDACDFIDGYFASCPDWVVLHDLRLGIGNQIFHLNHLLINDSLEFYCIDSRYIKYALSISSAGVFRACSNDRERLIASPVSKLGKDKRLLISFIKQSNILPRHFGVMRPLSVHGYVLTNPTMRTAKPRSQDFDASAVIPADSLFSLIWQEPGHWLNKRFKPCSRSVLVELAENLVALHKPTVSAHVLSLNGLPTVESTAIERDSAHCSDCGESVTELEREQSFRNLDTFGARVLCPDCQKKAWDLNRKPGFR